MGHHTAKRNAYQMDQPFVSIDDYEVYAKTKLGKVLFQFLEGAANSGFTVKQNIKAFKRYLFQPRYMKDVSNINLNTSVLGRKVDFPVGISPFAYSRLFDENGEKAVVKAAEDLNLCYIQSINSNYSIEELYQCAKTGCKWIQVYLFKSRSITIDIIRRAEQCGYEAVVLTVDAPVTGRKHNDLKNKFKIPSHLRLGNYETKEMKQLISESGGSHNDGISFTNSQFDKTLTWADVKWLKSQTKLKFVIKGVLTGNDANLALQSGADAIFVSNHGGRQLDGVPATLDCLKEVVKAVHGKCEVYMDGGIRSGPDILKALAIGARAVFIARPVAWALCHSGESGVRHMFGILKEELKTAMSLTGVSAVADIDETLVIHRNKLYAKL